MRVGHLATRSSCNKWKRIFRGGGGGGVLKRRRQRRRVTKGTELTVPLVEFLMGTLLSVPFVRKAPRYARIPMAYAVMAAGSEIV